jgi:deoxyribose-phosphate aldolase
MELSRLVSLAQEYEQELPPAPVQPAIPSGRQIASFIDHTLLKPEATAAQVKQLCQEALQHHFASVCVNPAYVPLACGLLGDAPEVVCTVIGFPLGALLPEFKSTKPWRVSVMAPQKSTW